jgi:hypothetical protein
MRNRKEGLEEGDKKSGSVYLIHSDFDVWVYIWVYVEKLSM